MKFEPIYEDGEFKYEINSDNIITLHGYFSIEPLSKDNQFILNHIHVDGDLMISDYYNELIIGDDVHVSGALCLYKCSKVLFNNTFKNIHSLSVMCCSIYGFSTNSISVNGSLHFGLVKFIDCFLPEDIKTERSFTLSECYYDASYRIKSLSVQGYMTYNNCHSVVLPDDLFVGENLNVNSNQSLTFGRGMNVHGNLDASGSLIENVINSDCFIGGIIDVRNSYALNGNITIKCFISRCVICSKDDITINTECSLIERVGKEVYDYRILFPTHNIGEFDTTKLSDWNVEDVLFNFNYE